MRQDTLCLVMILPDLLQEFVEGQCGSPVPGQFGGTFRALQPVSDAPVSSLVRVVP
jgi:hypothetical protein